MTRLFSFLMVCILSLSANAALDKAHFFEVIGSESHEQIKAERAALEKLAQSSEVKAYLGAMLMKEAQFQSTPKAKLEHFKKGRALLEAEIEKNESNTEYRFLRLMIQENAPKMLKYSSQVKEDADAVAKGYAKMNAAVKKVVKEYAKKSTALPSSKLSG